MQSHNQLGINREVIAPAQRSFSVVRARPAELSRLHMGCARMFELVCISMCMAVTAEPNPLPPRIVSLSPRAVGLVAKNVYINNP